MVKNMYSNQFVMAIKVNGAAQKELSDNSVILPFESEYSIHLRNKNKNRNAVAFVYIDNENVTPQGIVVKKGSSVDLERPTDSDYKFKFVSLDSSEAIEFGKDVNNRDRSMGVVEVRWHYEKESPKRVYLQPKTMPLDDYWRRPLQPPIIWHGSTSSSLLRGFSVDQANQKKAVEDAIYGASASFSASAQPPQSIQDGCTVEGNYSNQEFFEIDMEIEKDFVSMKLILKGVTQEEMNVRRANSEPKSRKVYGDIRSKPVLEDEEDPRIKKAKEELIDLELKLIEARKKKIQKELESLKE